MSTEQELRPSECPDGMRNRVVGSRIHHDTDNQAKEIHYGYFCC